MRLGLPGPRVSIPALFFTAAIVAVLSPRGQESALAAPLPAYELVPLPADLDTLATLEDAAARLSACEADCAEIVYVWTPRMPLSRSAIPNIDEAARSLGAGLTLVAFEDVERFAETGRAGSPSANELGTRLLGAGALAHAPSLTVFRGSEARGSAIMGYKSAAAYESMIADRLATEDGMDAAASVPSPLELPAKVAPVAFTDFSAIGVPGAYFKWVPGTRMLAYESRRVIYLLDMDDGSNLVAPGDIDFIPTVDGRYFVTPGPRNMGLVFFDAANVIEGARQGRSREVRPIFVDAAMRDQYPSVGILDEDETSVRYRILTSWFEGLLYRDYEVVHATDTSPATVRPLGEPIVPCMGTELSTPIMSQDGLEVAARDEATGTTKIYRFREDGRCDEVLPLGMPTRKVAWHPSGRMLAFSTPRVRTANSGGVEPGIFVYDRDERRVTRVADSNGASQLAFPDFVGEDAIVFMIPGRGAGQESRFRIVSPLP